MRNVAFNHLIVDQIGQQELQLVQVQLRVPLLLQWSVNEFQVDVVGFVVDLQGRLGSHGSRNPLDEVPQCYHPESLNGDEDARLDERVLICNQCFLKQA